MAYSICLGDDTWFQFMALEPVHPDYMPEVQITNYRFIDAKVVCMNL